MTELATPDLLPSIKGLLLLNKAENQTRNILAILGLQTSDFGDPKKVRILWDAEEITVQSATLQEECTCAPGDPKTHALGVQNYHTERCCQTLTHNLCSHENLLESDVDGDDSSYTFQWPRNIDGARPTLEVMFGELSDNNLWSNFKMSWARLTDQMGPEKQSQKERLDAVNGTALPLEDEDELTPEEVDGAGMDFEDDLDFGTLPTVAPLTLVPNRVLDAMEDLMEQDEVAEVKRGRGRPKGSTKAAKEQAKELKADDFVPSESGNLPALEKFGRFAAEEMSRLCGVVETIMTADDFPYDTIESFKNSLDRLALRAAHLQFRGAHDADAPGAINPLIEVSVANVVATVNSATRDLELAPEKPASWETFAGTIKEAVGMSKCLFEVMSQSGAGPVIQEIPRTVA